MSRTRVLLTFLYCLAITTLVYAAFRLLREDAWNWENWLLGPFLISTAVAVGQHLGRKRREQANG